MPILIHKYLGSRRSSIHCLILITIIKYLNVFK